MYQLHTGGQIYSSRKEDLEIHFDTSSASVIEGDVCVTSLDAKDKVVVVLGAVSVGGKEGASWQ